MQQDVASYMRGMAILAAQYAPIHWRRAAGHKGDPWNELAHRLATAANGDPEEGSSRMFGSWPLRPLGELSPRQAEMPWLLQPSWDANCMPFLLGISWPCVRSWPTPGHHVVPLFRQQFLLPSTARAIAAAVALLHCSMCILPPGWQGEGLPPPNKAARPRSNACATFP